MLVRAEQYKFIEKTITTRSGRVVSVLVAVTYCEDRVISARIVAVKPVSEAVETEPILLTASETEQVFSLVKSYSKSERVYFSDFSFFTSQLTRAPAGNF